jgi:DNA adenine methylase
MTGSSTAHLYLPARPVVKVTGGKGRIVHELIARLPPGAEKMRHVEPFVGGGAFFFARQPRRALLSDINSNLIGVYGSVRDSVEALIIYLRELAKDTSEAAYYAVRTDYNTTAIGNYPDNPVWQAGKYIYLNKLGYNGLHRVNKAGAFNVPYGRYKNPTILDETNLRAASRELQRVEIVSLDFEGCSSAVVERDDFVYFDAPYEPLSRTANFTSYAAGGFGRDDQERLQRVAGGLANRGIPVMLSNSDTLFIRALYKDWRIDTIQAPRAVSCKADGRKKVNELVIRSY